MNHHVDRTTLLAAAALRDASFNPLSLDGDTSKEGAKGKDTLGSSAVAVV
jgi:hypothetical protein